MRDEDDLASQAADQDHLLAGVPLDHDDDDAVAARDAHEGEADAGVTGRRLQDRPPGLQRAALLGRTDEAEGGPVLHAHARIQVLELREDIRLARLLQCAEPDHRGPPDQLDDALHDAHPPLPRARRTRRAPAKTQRSLVGGGGGEVKER